MGKFDHTIYDDEIYREANKLYEQNTSRGYYYKDAVFESLPNLPPYNKWTMDSPAFHTMLSAFKTKRSRYKIKT